jgi:hypothetical protein
VHASSPRTTAMTSRIHLRAKTNFASFFSLIWVVQSSREIYSASLLPPIGGYLPRPALLGAYASSRTLSAGCGGRKCAC